VSSPERPDMKNWFCKTPTKGYLNNLLVSRIISNYKLLCKKTTLSDL
jgi:hypothetical protein